MQNHNDDTIKTSHTVLLENIPLTLKGFERVTKRFTVRGLLETEQNSNILTPTLIAITAFLFRSPELFNRGPWGPASLGHVSQSSILSPTRLIQLIELPVHRVIYLFNVHLLLVGVTNRTQSTRPRSRLYPHIPRPDAPIIYTGAFHILTAWPGSICNTCSAQTMILTDHIRKRMFRHYLNGITIP